MSRNPELYHIPVLLKAALEGLSIEEKSIVIDATFGGGGHSRAILDVLGSGGRLVAFDKDADAQINAPRDDRFTLLHQDFRFLKLNLDHLGIGQVDGIIADLGISSHQIDEPERGFSIRFDKPLDLRMNTNKSQTAAELINDSDTSELAGILRTYGELRDAGRIAKAIEKHKPVTTTGALVDAIRPLVQANKINSYAARVFQALRIAVNDELNALKELLLQSVDVIKSGGHLVVISYHSLEDRMVKRFIRSGTFDGSVSKDFYGNVIRPFNPVSSKAIVPGDDEINQNPRARSARLRIAEKV